MTPSQLNFLIILKDAVRPQKEAASLVEPIDWKEIFSVAVKQNILPLVYDSASRFSGFAEFEAEHGSYFNTVMAAITNQVRRTDNFLKLYRAFSEAGIAPVTVKGIVCRSLYGEKQDYRPSGDEDLLIEKENFQKAADVLTRFGFVSEGVYADKDMHIVQEVTFTNRDGFVVELHVNPFGTETKVRQRMDSWFVNVFEKTVTLEIGGVAIRTLAPTDNFLFILCHAFKHFTQTGFGIRMMLDLLLFMERYHGEIDWEYINRALADIKAIGFLADIIALGNQYFGFSLPQNASSVCPEELLDDIFKMGTFGNTTLVDADSDRFTNMALNQEANFGSSKVRDMLRVLFPSWETWKHMKPFLVDKPYLLPIEWFKRLLRYQKQKRTGGVDLSASREVGKRRIKLLKKYGVI